MADITMCNNKNCEVKNMCYRYNAKPEYMQSYFEGENDNCQYFWEVAFCDDCKKSIRVDVCKTAKKTYCFDCYSKRYGD